MKQHQKELHDALQKIGVARFKGGKDGKTGSQGKTWKKFESYRRDDQLPSKMQSKRVSWKLFTFILKANQS